MGLFCGECVRVVASRALAMISNSPYTVRSTLVSFPSGDRDELGCCERSGHVSQTFLATIHRERQIRALGTLRMRSPG